MNNQEIFAVDREYRQLLKKVCKQTLTFYRGLPIEWEDIYNNFLFDTPIILKSFDENIGVSKSTFLCIRCKQFAMNYCRSFNTNKHKIMNNYEGALNDKSYQMEDKSQKSILRDSETPPDVLPSIFASPIEREMIRLYFIDDHSIREVVATTNHSSYRVRQTINKIKEKLSIGIQK